MSDSWPAESAETHAANAPRLLSYAAIVPDLQSGRSSPVDFLEGCLASIQEREGEIGAFEALNIEGAREAARASAARWASGQPLSNIDGMPIGIKDVIETADMPTGMGSPFFAGIRTGRDAASVKALREAGAIILGKTVTTEFAATFPGKTRNPLDLSRTPGGSSSGSAAGVAAGFFPAGLGTQVVGSIIRPASYCGVYGFKPSFGAINRGGSMDHMSQSSQGILAGSLADAWRVLQHIVQRTGGDPGYGGLGGPADLPAARLPGTLAVIRTAGWAGVSDELRKLFSDLLSRLTAAGIRVVGRGDSARVEAAEQAISTAFPVTRSIVTWESRWPLNIFHDMDPAKLSPIMRGRLADAEKMSLDDYRQSIGERESARAAYAALKAEGVEACITLSANGPAPVGLESTGDPGFATPSSYLGIPSISLPLLSVEGLPVGVQLMGFRDEDPELCSIAGGFKDVPGIG